MTSEEIDDVPTKGTFKGRRSVLKTSAALIGTSLTAQVTSAAESESNHYVGVTYNPQTGEVIGDASARLTNNSQLLNGVIRAGGIVLPVNEQAAAVRAHPITNQEVSRFGVKKGGNFKRNGIPMRVDVSRVKKNDITGVFDWGTAEEKIAFRIRKESQKESSDAIKQHIQSLLQGGSK